MQNNQAFCCLFGRSKGSCGETRSMSYVILDCNYITKEEFKELNDLCITISKKTRRFMNYLEKYDSNDRVCDVMVEYNGEL
jgi:four helix bundle protein